MKPILAALALFLALSQACAQSLTTTFAHDSGGGTGWTTFFDLDVHQTITVQGLDLNINAPTGSLGSIEIFRTAVGNSHSRNEFNSVWLRAGVGEPNTRSNPTGTPTTVALTQPTSFQPGRYGVAIAYTGSFAPAYTTGNGANQTFRSAEATLIAGTALSSSPATAGTLVSPRIWNGTLHYGEFARADIIGRGCGGGAPSSFYERLGTGNPVDLSWTGFSMNRDSIGGEYTIAASPGQIVTPTQPPLSIGDDQTVQVALPWQMATRGSNSTASLWICSNGFIGLQSTTSTAYNESVSELLGSPTRIAGFWDDLNPTGGGGVFAEQDPFRPELFHVTWSGVPEYGTLNWNEFQITFDRSGTITVRYGFMAATDGLVGYSHGNGALDPGPTDISNPMLALQTGNDVANVELRSIGRPVLGTQPRLDTLGIPLGSTAGALITGFSGSTTGIDLASAGMRNCALYANGPWVIPFVPVMGAASQPFTVGNDPALLGLEVWLQSAVVASGATSLGIAASNGIRWRIERR